MEAEHLYGPCCHATYPPCASLYRWLLQSTKVLTKNIIAPDEWVLQWGQRHRLNGPIVAISGALQWLRIGWTAPFTFQRGALQLDFTPPATYWAIPLEDCELP